jgi:hypothetical protein
MNIARVHNGIVINLEVMDEDWFAIQQQQTNDLLVPFEHPENPCIGLSYDSETGEWEQHPKPVIPEAPETTG